MMISLMTMAQIIVWYEEMVLMGNQAIISPTFPELTIKVEQVLAAGKLG